METLWFYQDIAKDKDTELDLESAVARFFLLILMNTEIIVWINMQISIESLQVYLFFACFLH